MDDPVKPKKEPQATTERTRYEFLTTDLEVCFTLAKLVESKIGLNDREAAKRALVKAERWLLGPSLGDDLHTSSSSIVHL
jgi:predicted Zn-dependent protease